MAPPASVRVLLVEDDRDDAGLVVDLLRDAKRASFIVDTAETAAECLSKVKQHRYDVLLLDYRLPDLSGLELMSELQRMHFRIPVVFVTGHGDRRLQDDALEAGVAEYLEKGTFTADLLERTCLYAIGLNERQVHNGADSGGVGLMVQELVNLTREGVTAQTNSAHQLSELRSEFREDFNRLQQEVKSLKDHADKQKDELLKEFSKGVWGRLKDSLEWVIKHPVASVVLFMGVILIVVLLVLLLEVIEPENIKAIKDALGEESNYAIPTHRSA